MKIILITKSISLHSSMRINAACKHESIPFEIITPSDLLTKPTKYFDNTIIINRNSAIDYTDKDLVYLDSLESTLISNPSKSTRIFRDKWLQYEIFTENKIPTIKSLNLEDCTLQEVEDFNTKSLNTDFLLKPKRSNQTIGILTSKNLMASYQSLTSEDDLRYIAQPLLSKKAEYRVLICFNNIIGILLKKHHNPYALLNCSTAKLEVLDLKNISKELKELINKTKIFELDFYAIDILEEQDGCLKIIEINNMPGFEKFQENTEIDVASILIQGLLKKYSIHFI